MRTTHLLGTAAIATLLATGAIAQEMIEIDGTQYERLEFQMDGERIARDEEGRLIVLMSDGTRVPNGAFAVAEDNTPYLVDRDFAMAEQDEMGNRVTLRQAQADTTAATGGQFIVRQAEPTVNVDVPDPTITVDQATPEVTIEQPQPEITVTQSQPRVSVQQQAPIITVEQEQPIVTVRIPEPVVTIRMPQPEVSVAQGEPEVAVETPQPVVRFVRPEPQIRIQEAQPQINVEQAEAQVDINRTTQADIRIEQAEAAVNIEEEEGEAEIVVTEAEPQVNIEQAGDAEIQVEQAEAQVDIQEAEGADVQVVEADTMETEAVVAETQVTEPRMFDVNSRQVANVQGYEAFYETSVQELIGMDVLAASGEDVGEVDNIAVMGDQLVAIVGIGGFLGLGEHDVAMPLSEFQMTADGLVTSASAEQLEGMEEYDAASAEFVPGENRVGDLVVR